MADQVLRVFLGSTYTDLIDHRATARDAIIQAGFYPVMMEDFTAYPDSSTELCIEKVSQSDIYVGIFATRYGYIPTGSKLSIMEMELRKAEEMNLPCYCFVLDLENHIDKERFKKSADPESEQQNLLSDLLKHIDQTKTRTSFKSAADLKHLIYQALMEHKDRMGSSPDASNQGAIDTQEVIKPSSVQSSARSNISLGILFLAVLVIAAILFLIVVPNLNTATQLQATATAYANETQQMQQILDHQTATQSAINAISTATALQGIALQQLIQTQTREALNTEGTDLADAATRRAENDRLEETSAAQTAAALTQQAAINQANADATLAARQTADVTVTAIIDMLTQRANEAATQTATAMIANTQAAAAVSALETQVALNAQSIASTATQAAIHQAETAAAWTDTPTATDTPTETLIPSITPLPTETPIPTLTPTLTPSATPAAPLGMSSTLMTVEGQAFYVQPRVVSNAEFKAFAMSSFYAGLVGVEPANQIPDDELPYMNVSWNAAYRYCTGYLQSILPVSTNLTYDLITMSQWGEARQKAVLQPVIGTAEWLRPDTIDIGQERYPTITLKANGNFERGEYTERAPGNFVFRCVARFKP